MVRTLGAVLLAAGLGLLGGQINGEYPLNGLQPILLAALLGAVVGRGVAWVGGQGGPKWLVAVAVVASAAGETVAVQNDLAGLAPWPAVGYLAVAAAALAAATSSWRITRGPGAKRVASGKARGSRPVRERRAPGGEREGGD